MQEQLLEPSRHPELRLDGPPALVRGFARWVRPSPFAHVQSVTAEA